MFSKKDSLPTKIKGQRYELGKEELEMRKASPKKKRSKKIDESSKEVFKYLDDLNLKITRLKHEMSKKLKKDEKFSQQRSELKSAFEQLEKKIFQCLIDTMNSNGPHRGYEAIKKL